VSEGLSISEARDRLGEIVSRAQFGGEHTVLTRRGKPVAVVISIDELRELQALEDEADLAAVRAALAEPGPSIPHEQAMRELDLQ
jgi:prevent-host-death family protein